MQKTRQLLKGVLPASAVKDFNSMLEAAKKEAREAKPEQQKSAEPIEILADPMTPPFEIVEGSPF
ncbi:MAG: hypothetical protein KJ787_04060 [Gammaproteobacteria bacterium]|nr:hypothetical protein [Gammaproteobacteria bacterium]MBU1645485.1 hypothetical protein [Gammaproteobacteria bacterium]MBU1971108.1 hypothetical protein [Gammaproteobacteria bacterium]